MDRNDHTNRHDKRSLNDFPDEILRHIISLLPTTELAARTSVLSKRWRYIWTSLEVLDLVGQITLLLSPQISLSNLKSLTLNGVPFTDYHELNILFAASALEELVLCHCEWKMDAPGELIISAPKLQTLCIYERLAYQTLSLHARLALSSITVVAPIRNFAYSGIVIRNFRFSCPTSIVTAMILCMTDHADTEDIQLHHIHEVLRSLRFVEYLDVPANAIKGPSIATLPIFENMISLVLNMDIVDLNHKEMETFLNKCPCLETLMLPQGISRWDVEDEDVFDINQPCPKFLNLSSLKNIMIGRIKGIMKELALVQILLEKATSLETMEIQLSELEESKIEEIQTFLSAIVTGSSSAKLKFC